MKPLFGRLSYLCHHRARCLKKKGDVYILRNLKFVCTSFNEPPCDYCPKLIFVVGSSSYLNLQFLLLCPDGDISETRRAIKGLKAGPQGRQLKVRFWRAPRCWTSSVDIYCWKTDVCYSYLQSFMVITGGHPWSYFCHRNVQALKQWRCLLAES